MPPAPTHTPIITTYSEGPKWEQFTQPDHPSTYISSLLPTWTWHSHPGVEMPTVLPLCLLVYSIVTNKPLGLLLPLVRSHLPEPVLYFSQPLFWIYLCTCSIKKKKNFFLTFQVLDADHGDNRKNCKYHVDYKFYINEIYLPPCPPPHRNIGLLSLKWKMRAWNLYLLRSICLSYGSMEHSV